MSQLIATPKQSDLIYDVGMHRGEDAEFYLKKGFRVIALEANPELVAMCRKKFAQHLAGDRLRIIEGAVVDIRTLRPGQKTIPFHVNKSISPGW